MNIAVLNCIKYRPFVGAQHCCTLLCIASKRKPLYIKRFLKDLADLPEDVQARIEPIVFQELESENPFELGYLQKMQGYDDKY